MRVMHGLRQLQEYTRHGTARQSCMALVIYDRSQRVWTLMGSTLCRSLMPQYLVRYNIYTNMVETIVMYTTDMRLFKFRGEIPNGC